MDEKELLEIIERAEKEGWAELDLMGKGIGQLPVEISKLVSLRELRLNDNNLTQLPPEIGCLINLERLYLRGNRICTLPKELQNLRGLTTLSLEDNGLESLPIEILGLTSLKTLDLHNNRLTYVPREIGGLGNLRVLELRENCMEELPTEIGLLIQLRVLTLGNNRITSLPPSIWQLKKLKKLELNTNRLKCLPEEIGRLRNLESLKFHNNLLSCIPSTLGNLRNLKELLLRNNAVNELPPEIGQLKNLTTLNLCNNKLSSLPAEIGQLKNLTIISLYNNQLTSLPAEIGQLKNLTELYLHNNKLVSLPAEIAQLKSLKVFYLGDNQLTSLTSEIGQLTNLTELYLHSNKLVSLPAEIGNLTNLKILSLRFNHFTSLPVEIGKLTNLTDLLLGQIRLSTLPVEIGQLTNLTTLDLTGNLLKSPPAEIVEQGTKAILEYLHAQLQEKRIRQWMSKLLVVGEGGVGKTSLLRALRGEDFVEGLDTTHGIGVDKLDLKHPNEAGVTMELNTWDFGGQQIYHATHQFFLTNRSVFLLVWDARHGWEAGKLYEWLDRIQAKAPESPVLIVATHIDERDTDLPLDDLRRKYPQILEHFKLSNKRGTGISEFKAKLAEVAARLPLMGEEWPASWVGAANEIRNIPEHFVTSKKLYEVMSGHGVKRNIADVLARWLHELGDILYFREDEELNDIVILDPEWVNRAISRVLESKEVIGKVGIFTRQHMDEIWADIGDDSIRQHLLRLMERFDLSYRTLENREISLIVELLPLDPPDYKSKWEGIKEKEGCKQISMKFDLSSIPAGIPTWFIARSHRFTTHMHWRNGALFADGGEARHLGLVEAYPHDRYVRLTVRGPAPNNFFTLLRDGLELTLGRFPGLRVKRTVPCLGHRGEACTYEFDFERLEKAIEREEPVLEVQCQEGFANVSVPGLLFGLHWSTEGNVINRIDELESKVVLGQERILAEFGELRALVQREFLRLYMALQEFGESHCPNVFAVLPKDEQGWLDEIFGQKMVLQLFCQEPGEWHPTLKGGQYEIKQPIEFLKSAGPYILKLSRVIKYAAPIAGAAAGSFAGPVGAVMGAAYAKQVGEQIKLMGELAKWLSEREYLEAELLENIGGGGKAERMEGAELRALRKLLDEADPKQHWGGLTKVWTPEGHYLWLCKYHAAKYKN